MKKRTNKRTRERVQVVFAERLRRAAAVGGDDECVAAAHVDGARRRASLRRAAARVGRSSEWERRRDDASQHAVDLLNAVEKQTQAAQRRGDARRGARAPRARTAI
jgi:hypothetical protein